MSVSPESYAKAVTSLTAAHFYAIGYLGDDDPGHALEEVLLYNGGTTDLRIGSSLTGTQAATNYQVVKAGTVLPLSGPKEGLIVYNPEAATAGVFSISADCWRRNAGKDGGVKARKDTPSSATRYYVARPSKVAGAVTDTSVVIRQRCTISAVKAYSVTVASGGTITLDLLLPSGSSLFSTVLNLEGITTKVLGSATLTASTGLLTIEPGTTLSLRYSSSAGGDTLGDCIVEIAVTEA